jgi:hypothetical protein
VPVDALHTSATELLDAAEAALDLTAAGAPARVFVSEGPPSFDCTADQLTVHAAFLGEFPTFAGLAVFDEGFRGHTRPAVIGPTLIVTSLRCVAMPGPAGQPPSVTAIQASAQVLLEDAWALWNHITEARVLGDIGELCKAVFRDGGVPIVNQGGVGGWQFTYRLEMNGGL